MLTEIGMFLRRLVTAVSTPPTTLSRSVTRVVMATERLAMESLSWTVAKILADMFRHKVEKLGLTHHLGQP